MSLLVGGVPALEQDSIHSLFDKAPLMLVVLLTTTMLLMFLAFGSVVLPIKAAVMSALTLGSTMGILTWIFVDGHFSKLLNFTPTPLMVVLIALVVAVGFGLATDYEVFLVSRMVEARARGMSTAEAIRIGTATTGRLITAAALVLAVVAGSFVFSDLVMMKYLAFGLMAALLLDATVVRMFLVPSVMKLLGDDCWWAPMWMKRLQNRLGLGEIHLPDERKRPVSRARAERPAVAARVPATTTPRPPHDPTHPGAEAPPRPARPAALGPRPEYRPPAQDLPPSAAGTTRMPTPGRAEPKEPPTTRFSAPPDRFAHPRPGTRTSAHTRAPSRTRRPAATTAKSSPGSASCVGRSPATVPPIRAAQPRRRRRNRRPIKPGRCRFHGTNRHGTTAHRTRGRHHRDPDRPAGRQGPRDRHREGERSRRERREPRPARVNAAAADSALRICCAARAGSSREFASG